MSVFISRSFWSKALFTAGLAITCFAISCGPLVAQDSCFACHDNAVHSLSNAPQSLSQIGTSYLDFFERDEAKRVLDAFFAVPTPMNAIVSSFASLEALEGGHPSLSQQEADELHLFILGLEQLDN